MNRRQATDLAFQFTQAGFTIAMTQSDGIDIGFIVYQGKEQKAVYDEEYGLRLLQEMTASAPSR